MCKQYKEKLLPFLKVMKEKVLKIETHSVLQPEYS